MQGQRNSIPTWLQALLVLAVCLPPLVIALGKQDSTHTMENIAVLTAQEAWLRWHGSPRDALEPDPSAWLLPTRDLQPRVVKPPGAVWLQLLTFTGLKPGDAGATPQDLIARARWSSVFVTLVLIGATFWLGYTIDGPRLAWLAALAAGSMWFVERQGRTASYDIHLAAWSALAAASGVWAMYVTTTWKRIAGWVIAGVATGLAWYAKNPLALVLSGVPWVCFVWHRRAGWIGHVIGMVCAMAIAAALVGPWYVWVAQNVPDAMDWWMTETEAQRDEYHMPWYYVGLLGLVAPWTLWLVSGLVQPWVKKARDVRGELLPAWLWFVAIFVIMSIPGAKQQRYILPIIPAAALLIGQVFAWHQKMADRGEVDEGINVLRVPHWIALVVVSIAAPIIFVVRPDWTGKLTVIEAIPLAVALLAIALLGARWHWRWRPMRAAVATAAWALLLTTAMWWGYVHSAKGHLTREIDGEERWMRLEYEKFNTLTPDVASEPIGMLWLPGTDQANEEFVIYSQRVMHRVKAEDVAASPWKYVIADDNEASGEAMRGAGFEPAATFLQDVDRPSVLWRRE